MATIKKQLSGGSTAPTLILEIMPKPYDVENNRTPVDYKFTIERPSAVSSEQMKTYIIKIGAKVITGSVIIGGVGSKTIASGTEYVEHNSDGSKIVNCSFSISVGITWSGVKNDTISNSANVTLPTIPRATVPEISETVTLGNTVTIGLKRASSKFTHNVYITIGDYVEKVASDVGVSAQWTTVLNLAKYITTGMSAKCKITCVTYSGDIKVGTKSAYTTILIPNTVIPSITSVNTLEANNSVVVGGFVKTQSRLYVEINASGIYDSEIIDITSILDGVIYKGKTFITETLRLSGSRTLKTVVTDSRGQKATKSTTITVLNYDEPRIALFNVDRCNADGTINDSGTHARIQYEYAVNPVNNKNTVDVSIYYFSDGEPTLLRKNGSYAEFDTIITEPLFDIDKSYRFLMIARDLFAETTSYSDIETDITTFDIHNSGIGMAFGKVSEKAGLFDVNWSAKFNKDVEFSRDTDWKEIPLTDEFVPYNSEQRPRYRIRDRTVEIRGAVSPKTAYLSSSERKVFASVPKEIAPETGIYLLCQGSGKATWSFSILPDGTLTIARYGKTDYEQVPLNAWLTFQATYTLN